MAVQPIGILPPRLEPVLNSTGQMAQNWAGWLRRLSATVNAGFTGTITTAKLTAGGTNGSMTFSNGVLIAQVAAT